MDNLCFIFYFPPRALSNKAAKACEKNSDLIKAINKELDVKAKKVDIDTKFFIIDRKEILFYLSKDSNDEDVAIWINSEFFSQAFASLFDRALGGK